MLPSLLVERFYDFNLITKHNLSMNYHSNLNPSQPPTSRSVFILSVHSETLYKSVKVYKSVGLGFKKVSQQPWAFYLPNRDRL